MERDERRMVMMVLVKVDAGWIERSEQARKDMNN